MRRVVVVAALVACIPSVASAWPDFSTELRNSASNIFDDSVFDETVREGGTAIDVTLRSERQGDAAETTLRISEISGEISISVSHTRTDVMDSLVGSEASISFIADRDYAYAMSGRYGEILPAGNWIGASVSLQTFTGDDDTGGGVNTQLFRHSQVSFRTSAEELVLGSLDGGYFQNDVEGSTSGVTPAGVDVSYSLFVGLLNPPTYSAGTSAAGEYVLTLTPIPEPSVCLLLGAGLAILSQHRRIH